MTHASSALGFSCVPGSEPASPRGGPAASSPIPGPSLESAFARTLRTERRSIERFVGSLDQTWQVLRGPNGGFLAALLLDALARRLDDPARRPRVLSAHYLKVPSPGPIEVHTRLLRQGRSIAWLSAELHQQGEPCVVARAAFSSDWPSIEYRRLQPPVPFDPDRGELLHEGLPPFAQNFEYRSLFASPGHSGVSDAVGGYIRLREAHPYAAPLLASLSDAWFPSTFAMDDRPVMAATLDLTVHFRDHAALEALDPTSFVLSIFRSRLATEGFFEEDGEIFAPDGRVLAQSRQLAIAAPYA